MPNENIETARVIFLKYGGSHFHMAREGEYEHYKNFNISKEQEKLWIKEYHIETIIEISDESIASKFTFKLSKLSNSIISFKDMDSFQSMFDIIQKKIDSIDSFSKLRVAEEILNIVDAFKKQNINKDNVLTYARKFALDILNSIVQEPITVDSSYNNIGYLKDLISKDKIIDRVQKLIKVYDIN